MRPLVDSVQRRVINLPAVILIVMVALLLIRGASESATVNAVMVMIKIAVLVMFIVIGVTGWDSANLTPFAADGLTGVTSAAGLIFFSYIGLDAVSTAGEEVKNPQAEPAARDPGRAGDRHDPLHPRLADRRRGTAGSRLRRPGGRPGRRSWRTSPGRSGPAR